MCVPYVPGVHVCTYTPGVHMYIHTRRACIPYIPGLHVYIHTRHACVPYTPGVHVCHTYQACMCAMHTRRACVPYTPGVHVYIHTSNIVCTVEDIIKARIAREVDPCIKDLAEIHLSIPPALC